MRKLIDLTGQTFGRLTVIERAENQGKRVMWRCCCSCGNECVVRGGDLKSGKTQSCGCYNHEKITRHGMKHTKIYNTWRKMKNRCENPNDPSFDRYGGRGIKVCERWHIFENFYADVSILPYFGEKGYSLDRIDVNGDYEPGNVRWATRKEQSNNRRNTIFVEYKGEKLCLKDAAKLSGLTYSTLKSRYKRGLRGDELFKTVER